MWVPKRVEQDGEEWTPEMALARVDWLKGEALGGDATALTELRGLLDDDTFPNEAKKAAEQAILDLGAGPVKDQIDL